MGLLNKCTMRWRPAIGWGLLAFKSLRPLPSQQSSARGRAPSSSTTPKSNSPWCSGRWGPQQGSSGRHTRHPGLTCSCNRLIACWFCHLKAWLFWLVCYAESRQDKFYLTCEPKHSAKSIFQILMIVWFGSLMTSLLNLVFLIYYLFFFKKKSKKKKRSLVDLIANLVRHFWLIL